MLLSNLNLLAKAPNGVARLRELILTLAVQGKLVPQDPKDEPASALLKKIRAEKDRLIAEGKIKRDKPLAEIAEEEKPFGLPRGWEWVRASDLCSMVTDGEHLTPQRCDDVTAVPLVTAKNVRHEVMDYRVTDFVPREVAEKCWLRCKPLTGDILMVSVGATLGRLCVLRDAVDMVLVRSVTVLRPVQAGVMPDFLARHLMSPGTQREIWGEVKQSAQPCLYLAKSAALKIALPPLAEQSRIVTRVEELMRLCDALEAKGQLEATQHAQLVSTLLATLSESETPAQLTENWQRIATHFDLLLDRPQAVDALEQTILQLAVRGLLVPQDPQDEPASVLLKKVRVEKDKLIAAGKIKRDKPLPPIAEDEQPFALPQGWEWVRIEEIAEVQGGIQKTQLRRPVREHYPYLRVANVQRDALRLGEIERFELTQEELTKWRLAAGDLLIVEGNGSADEIGRCAVWDGSIDPCVYQNHLIRVRCLQQDSMAFMKLFLNAPSGMEEMKRLAITTSGLYNLSVGKIRNYVVPVPPFAEQSRIVTRVAQLRRLCSDLRQRLSASQSTQAHLAEALVQEVQQ
jgi:type I restriction enzyme S subunit